MTLFSEEQPQEANPRELIGCTVAGRYRVESLLGVGGMGAVYLVQHTGIRKRLALKVLSRRMMSMPSVVARFEREAMAAAHIEHPNVAAASDYGRTEDGRFFLVLEYVEGRELRGALDDARGPMPAPRALFIARQITAALERAHELGIVHRDLKPENIMLVQRDGHEDFVKVLDFGLAQVSRRIASDSEAEQEPTAPKLTQVGEIFGTPAYMAPEQSIGGDVDIRTDLYALGVILYEMLAGVRPFRGRSQLELIQAHLTTKPPPMKERAPKAKVSPALEAIVRRLLEKQADDRFQDPKSLLAAIDELAAAESISLPGIGALMRSSSQPALAPVRDSTPTPMPSPVPKAAEKSSDSSPPGPSLVQRFSSLRGRVMPIIERARAKIFRKETTGDKLKRALTSFGRVFQKKEKPRGLLARGPLLGVAALIIVVAALLVYWRGSKKDSDMPALPQSKLVAPQIVPPEQQASAAAIDAATVQGTAALSTLAGRFSKDARVLRALVKAQGNQREYVEAMQTLSRLAALDGNVGRDPEMVRVIVAALQGGPEAIQAAAGLMEQALGEGGIDLLYDMTVKQTQARWKPRLNQSLTHPEVLARASAATRVALELRNAKTCEAKLHLLPRVAKEGSERALVQLRSLTTTSGCGFLGTGDCWPCLRRGTALRDAIAATDARAKQAP